MPNPPSRHHFLPEFYLRGWAGSDGRIERYSSEHNGRIHARRVHPSAAAFQRDLYRIPGEHPDEWAAQRLETDFFGPLDDAAACVLAKMISSKCVPTDSDGRSTWASFLLSLLHRTPEHLLATLTAARQLNDELMPEAERRYEELRGPHDPPTFAEWEKERAPHVVDRSAMDAMMHLIVSPKSGPKLIYMHWMIVDVSGAENQLLTSDNPVILVPVDLEDGHIGIPLSPTLLFVATQYRRIRDAMLATAPSLLVRTVNRLTVERATLYVIATSQAQDRFIRRWFGSCRIGSFATGLKQPSRRG